MAKYLDITGLRALWAKMKNYVTTNAPTYKLSDGKKDLIVNGLNDVELRLTDDGTGSIRIFGNNPPAATSLGADNSADNIYIASGDTMKLATEGTSIAMGHTALDMSFKTFFHIFCNNVSLFKMNAGGEITDVTSIEAGVVKGGFGRLNATDTQISSKQIKLRASATNNITLTETQNKFVGNTLFKDGVIERSFTSSYSSTAITDVTATNFVKNNFSFDNGDVQDIANVRIIDIDDVSAVLKINFNQLGGNAVVSLRDVNDNVITYSNANVAGYGAALLFTVPTHSLAMSAPVFYTININ